MNSIVKVVLTFVLLFSTTTIVSAASYTYDELNRLTKVTYEDGTIVSYTYDAAGNILSVKNELKGEGNDEGEEKGDQYDEMPMQSNVEPDKLWSIRFNQEVDMEKLRDGMIYVKDSNGTIVEGTGFKVLAEHPDVIILYPPTNGYIAGETYTLFITDEITSHKGVSLRRGVKMGFNIMN